MINFGGMSAKWSGLKEKLGPGFRKTCVIFKKIGSVIHETGRWVFKLRRFFMAIPVVWIAIRLAVENLARLPEQVGLNLQSSGEFAQLVSRDYAVYGPLGVTFLCVLLMFFTRKTLFPWLISIFSLVLPYFIYVTNMFPA